MTARVLSTPGRLNLRSVGSFHIGGQRKTLQGLPVEQVRLAVVRPRAAWTPTAVM